MGMAAFECRNAAPGAGTSIADLLQVGRRELRKHGIASPGLDADLLLAKVLEGPREHLYAQWHKEVPPEARYRYHRLLERRCRREPMAYLIGRKAFWSVELGIGPGVLIPRPETELLVSSVCRRLGTRRLRTVIDLCCGAAPLAVALAMELQLDRMIAVDCSLPALAYARKNVLDHGLGDRVRFVAADLLSCWGPSLQKVDLIVCNPPYIPSRKVLETMPEVALYEPSLALDGGPSGLEVTERVLADAARVLDPNGVLVLETGRGLMGDLVALARGRGFGNVEVLHDLAGIERALWVSQ